MKKKQYIIKSTYDEVTNACKEIRAFCLNNNVPSKTSNEIEICLVEALNNIVKHAYKEDFSQSIKINVIIEDQSLSLELIDQGCSRKEFKKPTLEYDPEDIDNLPEGGMGLYIIDQLMSEISYQIKDGSNIFLMKKSLL